MVFKKSDFFFEKSKFSQNALKNLSGPLKKPNQGVQENTKSRSLNLEPSVTMNQTPFKNWTIGNGKSRFGVKIDPPKESNSSNQEFEPMNDQPLKPGKPLKITKPIMKSIEIAGAKKPICEQKKTLKTLTPPKSILDHIGEQPLPPMVLDL